MQIATLIRKAIDADPRPQREIAKAAKMHEVNLSQFKAGTRMLKLDALVHLAEALGLEISVVKKKHK